MRLFDYTGFAMLTYTIKQGMTGFEPVGEEELAGKMTSGDIGATPEGFVSGQENIFPIVGNSTVTLKDTKVAVRNNLTASSWDSMVDGTAQYRIEGGYSYRLTGSNFQTSYYEKGFTLTFP